jgi:hypothetical protein
MAISPALVHVAPQALAEAGETRHDCEEPLAEWARQREERRTQAKGRLRAAPLAAGPHRASHVAPDAPRVIEEFDGSQWVAVSIVENLAAAKATLYPPHRATHLMFWFPKSPSHQPIALYELGMLAARQTPLFVGADPGYVRRTNLLAQLSHARPGLVAQDTLTATVESVRLALEASAGAA